MKTIKIDINLSVAIFFLIGIVFGLLLGMIIQNAIIIEQVGNLVEKLHIENFNFEINQTKLVQDLWSVYNGS